MTAAMGEGVYKNTSMPTKSKSGKGSKDSKGSRSVPANPVAISESELEGLVGSAFEGMFYGPVFLNDMPIGQIDEESSSF
jgi:hypothetical protein